MARTRQTIGQEKLLLGTGERPEWVLDEETRLAGLSGVVAARLAIKAGEDEVRVQTPNQGDPVFELVEELLPPRS